MCRRRMKSSYVVGIMQNFVSDHDYCVEERICTVDKDTYLNISFVNVCGLVSKLHNQDFVEFVKTFDIFHFAETK
jgi:hypothetical protein